MNYEEIEKRRQEQLDQGISLSSSAVYSVSQSRDEVLDLIALLVSRLERIDVYENKESIRNRVKRNLEKYSYPAKGSLKLVKTYSSVRSKVLDKEGNKYTITGTGGNISVRDDQDNFHVFPLSSLFYKPILWLGDAAIYYGTTLIHKDWTTLYEIKGGLLEGGPGCPAFPLPPDRTLDPLVWRLW